jgi:hypothetical protein
MATPFTIEAKLSLPPDDGAVPADIDTLVGGTYTSKVDVELAFTGSDPQNVPFGTLSSAGAKVVYLEYKQGTAPINVRFNDGIVDMELAVGGCIAYVNPTPSSGITSLAIIHTAAGTARVVLLG